MQAQDERARRTGPFQDDPELGRFIANFPARRFRLLLNGGIVLLLVWFVVTVALWQVDAATASIITVAVMTLAALLTGWYMIHLWNREVVLYEGGFSYRRGSSVAYIPFEEVASTRQTGERLSYFGGLVKRSTYRFTIITDAGEVIVLSTLYAHLDTLTHKLEAAITAALRPQVDARLSAGERVSFGESIALDSEGLHTGDYRLPWGAFGGINVADGMLHIQDTDGNTWHTVSLQAVDNVRLLVDMLREREPDQVGKAG